MKGGVVESQLRKGAEGDGLSEKMTTGMSDSRYETVIRARRATTPTF